MKKSVQEQARHFVQQKETQNLERLTEHIKNLRTLLDRAKQSAHGTRKRNEQGFIDKGCGCRSCRAKVTRLERQLEKALIKWDKERRRMYVGDVFEVNDEEE